MLKKVKMGEIFSFTLSRLHFGRIRGWNFFFFL